jgi:hypothetical protein
MKWITRERPKIDRIACPWLIKKFIDVEAEFIYVPLGLAHYIFLNTLSPVVLPPDEVFFHYSVDPACGFANIQQNACHSGI